MLYQTPDTRSLSGDLSENLFKDASRRSLHVLATNNRPLLQKPNFQRRWCTSMSGPRCRDKSPLASAASARSRYLKWPHRNFNLYSVLSPLYFISMVSLMSALAWAWVWVAGDGKVLWVWFFRRNSVVGNRF